MSLENPSQLALPLRSRAPFYQEKEVKVGGMEIKEEQAIKVVVRVVVVVVLRVVAVVLARTAGASALSGRF